ncbi:MAG: hypothetical protein SGJ02_08570 [bacterium]|nr:hypothetical protein [bacterium]
MTENVVAENTGASETEAPVSASELSDSQQPTPSPAETPLKKTEPQKPPPNILFLPFIEAVIKKIPIEIFLESYRITAKGFFVSLTATNDIQSRYKEWAVTHGNEDIKDEKIFKKLFASETPQKYYLAEGKKVLSGYFIECFIQNPQNYRKPYYLGTPDSARDRLHSSDELFKSVDGLRSAQGKEGPELILSMPEGEIIIPMEMVQRFARLASNSKRLTERFPTMKDNLSEASKALVATIRRSKTIKIEEEIIRPLRYARDGDRVSCRTRSGFYFLISPYKRLVSVYHLFGKNLYSFVRDEVAYSLARETHGRMGSFEIFSRKSKPVGTLIVRGHKAFIHGQALTNFIKEALDNSAFLKTQKPEVKPIAKVEENKFQKPNKKPHFVKEVKKTKTIRDFVEVFINTLQLSQPIATGKVSSYLRKRYQRGFDVLVNDVWLFVFNERRLLVDCLTRTNKNRAT